MNKPFIVVFLGFPGSGKTHFSRQLAKELQAVTLNSDALRLSMFDSLEKIDQIRHYGDRSRLYEDVFGAMDYAARQCLLAAGHSVVYDAQQTKRRDRQGIEKIAEETGATPVLVWMKTRREVALKRGQERETRDDSNQYDADKMVKLIDRFDKVADLPEPGENIIEISGEIPFVEQYEVFQKGVGEFS